MVEMVPNGLGRGKWSQDGENSLGKKEMASEGGKWLKVKGYSLKLKVKCKRLKVKGYRLKETGWAVPALWSCF
jgi:hypothetical protein